MTATYPQAVDAMYALFKAAWEAGATAIVGSIPHVRWEGVEEPAKPITDAYWCRVSEQVVLDGQTTLKTGVAPSENRRYTARGLLFVQLFCPMSDAQAYDKGRQLAVLARDAFRGKQTANGVWFRNCRINKLTPDENAYRFNIVVEYEYDDIG